MILGGDNRSCRSVVPTAQTFPNRETRFVDAVEQVGAVIGHGIAPFLPQLPDQLVGAQGCGVPRATTWGTPLAAADRLRADSAPGVFPSGLILLLGDLVSH